VKKPYEAVSKGRVKVEDPGDLEDIVNRLGGKTFQRPVKPSTADLEAGNVVPYSRARSQKKGYTRLESENFSEWMKKPEPGRGTEGQGIGYGDLRKSPDYTKQSNTWESRHQVVKDPGEAISKRAASHFNQLTPAERYKAGFEDWSDLYEVWQARFDAGDKSGLPKDVYQMFSKLLREEQGATATGSRNFLKEAIEGDPKKSMTKQALDLGRELFEGKVDPKELRAAHETFKSMAKDDPNLVMRNQYFTEAFEFADILSGKTAGKESKIKLFQMSGDLPKNFKF